MPLYEYQCDACAHRFEVIQRFSDPPIEVCPKCGGTVKKLLSSPAIQFKGSGWYITDYARKGGESSAAPASSEPTADTTSDAKADTKADTKTDTKTDTKADG
jgi:putative FmdB family regulatory protein